MENNHYVVERKRVVNSDKFRKAAIHYDTHGFYTAAPKGTTEYKKYWDRELLRSLIGYTSDDGDYISGYFYFYLNYSRIQVTTEKIITDRNGVTRRSNVREESFPDFYDYDWEYFNAIEEAERRGTHLVVIKKRGAGYEQPYSEIVMTPSGERTMGSLKKGDWVMNPAGYSVRIDEIVEQGLQEVYEVELQDGRKVTCGENHLWSVFNRRKKIEIKTTSELMNLKLIQGSKGKETYAYHLPGINEIEFGKKDIHIDPYILGALIGDGDLNGSQVKISSDDEEIINVFIDRLSDYTIKKTTTPFKYSIISPDRTNNKLNRELKRLGLKTTSYHKFIPEEYKYSTIEDRYELVRGLLDTDGSITDKGSIRFSSVSEKLVDDLAYVLRSLGIRCRKSDVHISTKKTKFPNGYESMTAPFWVLTITTGKDVFKISRKRNKIKKECPFYNRDRIGIKKITNLNRKEQQRCIVVENENSLYLTRDFIPTHNSFKGASMLNRNFYCIPNSKSYAIASEMEFLTKDGLLTKAWDMMSFIDTNTAWGKRRQKIDRATHKRASFVYEDADSGVKIEAGWGSEIIGVSLKNDAQKARGKRGKLILWEEAGKFPNLKQAWTVARPSVEDGSMTFGLMVAYGTGGTADADYSGLKQLFYEPDVYNTLPIKNIWDEGNPDKPCGFFVPWYTNMSGVNAEGKPFMDKDGNSFIARAIKYSLIEREKVAEASDRRSIDMYIAERPFTPEEATLQLTGNIFPKKELIRHMSDIKNNKALSGFKQVGDLIYDKDGLLKWEPAARPKDITTFRVRKEDDIEGQVVIWEHPPEDKPYGLYIMGVDPYDHDQSTTDSLGSVFVYKRFQNFEEYYDMPVAEYTGRPDTANDFYEIVRKLSIYYNAKILYENEKKGLFSYFSHKHSEYMLADQPDIIKDVVANSSVTRGKGIHMTKEIKAWGELLIRDWLREEYAEGRLNLTKIFSEPLLEELISYNPEGNFDRVMALMMVMIYKEELYHSTVKERKEKVRSKLFEMPLFTHKI